MFGSRSLLVCIGLLAASSFFSTANAQSKKAVLVYSADVEKALNSKSLKLLGGSDFLRLMEMDREAVEVVKNVNSVSVFVGAPAAVLDPEVLSETDFLVILRMNKVEIAEKMEEELKGGFVEYELKGKKVLKADGPGAPPIFAHRDGQVLRFGSDDFLFSDPKSLVGKDLQPLLDNLKDKPLKMVANFDGARDFLSEVSRVANENADFMSRQYIGLLDQVQTVEVGWDLDGDTIFYSRIKGHNEDENSKIKLKIDAAVGLLKGFLDIGLADLEKESPDVAKFAEAIMNGISVESKQGTVIKLKRPDGYEEMLLKTMGAARKAQTQTQDLNKMKQMALAKHNYFDTNRQFPFAADKTKNVSWRVNVLPYAEESNLYDEFNLDEKWSSDTNKKLISNMPETFVFSNGAVASVVKPKDMPRSFADVRDGTSNTIVFIENRKASMVPWTKPHGVTPEQVVKMVSSLKDGDQLIIAFYDGSVRRISNQTSEETLRKLCDPRDGKIIEVDEIK